MQAEDEYLQATADVLETSSVLTEKIFKAVHAIHAKWNELNYAAREQMGEIIEDYMDSREGYLASLPVEERRRLEQLYPKWW